MTNFITHTINCDGITCCYVIDRDSEQRLCATFYGETAELDADNYIRDKQREQAATRAVNSEETPMLLKEQAR